MSQRGQSKSDIEQAVEEGCVYAVDKLVEGGENFGGTTYVFVTFAGGAETDDGGDE